MPPIKEYSQKPSNFNLIKSLDLTSNLFQMQGRQKHVTLNHGMQFAKPLVPIGNYDVETA